jgi:hypothetical protein
MRNFTARALTASQQTSSDRSHDAVGAWNSYCTSSARAEEVEMNSVALYEAMELRAHSLVGEVPLHYVGMAELPGGPPGLNMGQLMTATGFASEAGVRVGPVTQALFALRGFVGRLFGWDDDEQLAARETYAGCLSADDRARSTVAPGTRHGIIRDLYLFDQEYAGEIVNRTVHAFVVLASEPTSRGYLLMFAIHVRKVSRLTPLYMALIAAPCYWIIYPSMRRGMLRRWRETFPPERLETPAHA